MHFSKYAPDTRCQSPYTSIFSSSFLVVTRVDEKAVVLVLMIIKFQGAWNFILTKFDRTLAFTGNKKGCTSGRSLISLSMDSRIVESTTTGSVRRLFAGRC